MELKKVDGWQTTDEQIFSSHSEAVEYQKYLDIRSKIHKWVATHCRPGMLMVDIEAELIKYSDELK